MTHNLWHFKDNLGNFESSCADRLRSLYFPLCNELLLSCITPTLHGDIKTGPNSFLLVPVSRIDLENSRSSRNFWVVTAKGRVWSATGASKDLKQIEQDDFKLEAGPLWHKTIRENREIGLRAEILSFVPHAADPVELMVVRFTNISSSKITFTPTAAIPMYARGADNLRDHRHVTSLLNRLSLHRLGVIVKPTLVFDESGHRPNQTAYFVLGWDEKFKAPQYIYPTQEMFCRDEGDLEAPASLLKNILPDKQQIQGREAMGGLRFSPVSLKPHESRSYIVLMGISKNRGQIPALIQKYRSLKQVQKSFSGTRDYWQEQSRNISVLTGEPDFDNWFRWVSIQPILRRIFGCSFLPDFDYGKGGRGWRDLWQDCLGLILTDPSKVRSLLIDNFSGVRIDGSNATVIGKKPGEFIADRNNISRVWMDHGIWPLLTLDLYMHESGDPGILFEKAAYFRDQHILRCRKQDSHGGPDQDNRLRTSSGKVYTGTVLEHLLVQNLVPFFNVGEHNFIRLEGADWNDGLDMAGERGESIAFSSMYSHNLKLLSDLLLKSGRPKIAVAKELNILLGQTRYNNVKEKRQVLDGYFAKTTPFVSGETMMMGTAKLADDLRRKAMWLEKHIRENEWLKEGFFNGYYDNTGRRVEGKKKGAVRMSLTAQVFPIMSQVAQEAHVEQILRAIEKYLQDKKLRGIHLNTDFKEEQHELGRAFSFVYGDKENGAFFNHMVAMLAYALYKRKFVSHGWQVLSSIYRMALDTKRSKIYPCLPEYFNLQGRGMYSYLTGSASWFVLTLLTQTFGVRGKEGDLLIEPKLSAAQFKHAEVLSIRRSFCGRCLEISFFNPKKLDYGRYKIIRATLDSRTLAAKDSCGLILSRNSLLKLSSRKTHKINIHLG